MKYVAKIYQIGIYFVLNTHNLDMILQLKYMTDNNESASIDQKY